MAENKITAPGTRPEATGKTRREAFTALGATALAGIAAAGFAAPDIVAQSAPLSTDAALLAACAAFDAAHQEQERSNAAGGWDDLEVARVSEQWYDAVEGITDAPRPQTVEGRVALARAARIALTDQVATTIGWTYDEQATKEERLVMAALESVMEMRA